MSGTHSTACCWGLVRLPGLPPSKGNRLLQASGAQALHICEGWAVSKPGSHEAGMVCRQHSVHRQRLLLGLCQERRPLPSSGCNEKAVQGKTGRGLAATRLGRADARPPPAAAAPAPGALFSLRSCRQPLRPPVPSHSGTALPQGLSCLLGGAASSLRMYST